MNYKELRARLDGYFSNITNRRKLDVLLTELPTDTVSLTEFTAVDKSIHVMRITLLAEIDVSIVWISGEYQGYDVHFDNQLFLASSKLLTAIDQSVWFNLRELDAVPNYVSLKEFNHESH